MEEAPTGGDNGMTAGQRDDRETACCVFQQSKLQDDKCRTVEH